jgi:hypothetical protein
VNTAKPVAPPPLPTQLRTFAAHLRDAHANPPPPGIEARRLAVYRELFFNNIRQLLAGNFPVLRSSLGEHAWLALVRDFHADHRAATPLFPEIGQEFLAFLRQRQDAGRGDPPWLQELAHYEWIELALQIADAPLPAHDPHGDLLAGMPVVSPLAWPLAYAWPVQSIGPGNLPDTAPDAPTLLLLRRDADGEVHFSAISPLVYRLLELLDADSGASGNTVLAQLAREAAASDPHAFLQQGADMLRQLHREGTVLGTRAPSNG